MNAVINLMNTGCVVIINYIVLLFSYYASNTF